MKKTFVTRLIKSEDLNHHGTLFAGRMAEWFVEGSFISAACLYGNPENIVCLKMHGLKFAAPARKGEIITIETQVVYAGRTSFTVYGNVKRDCDDSILVDGFTTFVCIDENGNKMPHNIILPEPQDEMEKSLKKQAMELKH